MIHTVSAPVKTDNSKGETLIYNVTESLSRYFDLFWKSQRFATSLLRLMTIIHSNNQYILVSCKHLTVNRKMLRNWEVNQYSIWYIYIIILIIYKKKHKKYYYYINYTIVYAYTALIANISFFQRRCIKNAIKII